MLILQYSIEQDLHKGVSELYKNYLFIQLLYEDGLELVLYCKRRV